jgi:hypothetical protein
MAAAISQNLNTDCVKDFKSLEISEIKVSVNRNESPNCLEDRSPTGLLFRFTGLPVKDKDAVKLVDPPIREDMEGVFDVVLKPAEEERLKRARRQGRVLKGTTQINVPTESKIRKRTPEPVSCPFKWVIPEKRFKVDFSKVY